MNNAQQFRIILLLKGISLDSTPPSSFPISYPPGATCANYTMKIGFEGQELESQLPFIDALTFDFKEARAGQRLSVSLHKKDGGEATGHGEIRVP